MINNINIIEKQIQKLIDIANLEEFKQNNIKEYNDIIYIIESYSKSLILKSETFQEKQIASLHKLLKSVTNKHKEFQLIEEKIKTQTNLILATKQIAMSVKELTNEQDIMEYRLKYNGLFNMFVKQILDNYKYIKENATPTSPELFESTKKLRELAETHKELKSLIEKIIKEENKSEYEENPEVLEAKGKSI